MSDDDIMRAEAWRVARMLKRFGVHRVRIACLRSGNRLGDRFDRWFLTDYACDKAREAWYWFAQLN